MRDVLPTGGQQKTKRRDFLSKFLGLWSVVTVVPVINAILEFVTPPKPREATAEIFRAASMNDIPLNSAKVVKFKREPIIIVHTPSGQFKAFSARCTHLGCIVQYKPGDQPHFECNCHGSQFDASGRNIGGPAPSPLQALRVKLEESSILISKL